MPANQTRNIFFKKIDDLMSLDKNIIIVSVDLAGPPFDNIRKCYPDRYIGIGIAEQNSIAVSCGLAATGKKVIVYAANPFPFLRAFDQIRNCACTMKIPITIVGLGTGFSVAECGMTHIAIEDIALASLCCGLDIYSISDTKMAEFMALQVTSFTKPTYLRFGKWSGSPLGNFSLETYRKGYRKVKEGNDVAIVATGCTVPLLLDMCLSDDFAIYDWFKLSDSKNICESLQKYSHIISVEEQLKRGGIGSILLETFNDYDIRKNIDRIGIDFGDSYPQEYGNRDYWLNRLKINKEHIMLLCEKVLC